MSLHTSSSGSWKPRPTSSKVKPLNLNITESVQVGVHGISGVHALEFHSDLGLFWRLAQRHSVIVSSLNTVSMFSVLISVFPVSMSMSWFAFCEEGTDSKLKLSCFYFVLFLYLEEVLTGEVEFGLD